jgi:hypothetical protein
MKAHRVLIALGTEGDWARGILRGFMAAARERDWTVLHYHPACDLTGVLDDEAPTVAVVGPELGPAQIGRFASTLVSVTVDRSADGVASVCPDEEGIAALAVEHLLATGLRQVTTFRYDESPFARLGRKRLQPGAALRESGCHGEVVARLAEALRRLHVHRWLGASRGALRTRGRLARAGRPRARQRGQ